LAYDLKMRRFFICFLLILMPLRLWAGVWMPMAKIASHDDSQSVHVIQNAQVQTAHDCHETSAESVHGSNAPAQTPTDATAQKTDCHDGTCQLCAVCHQSANLFLWPLLMAVSPAHTLPMGVSSSHPLRTAPPLIKPPIS
jgi:hypothetical protein